MRVEDFKQLKIGDILITLGTISSKNGQNNEEFIVPAGTEILVKPPIYYAEILDDYYVVCTTGYRIKNGWRWGELKIGEISVNPADVEFKNC